MLTIIWILVFFSVSALAYYLVPMAGQGYVSFQRKRSENLADEMDQLFVRVKINKILLLYTLGPVVLGFAGYLFFPKELALVGILVGGILGFLGPSMYVRNLTGRRRTKFHDQLVDSLMIMSSSLKGGLSIIQALEVVTEEMSDPIRQEFSILLGENKMGVSLEEAFDHLYKRMPSIALHQLITAILLARETGGNLPVIFARIVTTIRENKKIKQNLDNLTLQGKIQGGVMSLLPVGFAVIVFSTNKHFFDIMLNSDIGRGLLIYAVISEAIGGFLIWKISTVREF